MSIVNIIQKNVAASLSDLYNQSFSEKDFQVNQTKPEFEGDYTVVMFSLVKTLKISPEPLGTQLGVKLTHTYPDLFSGFNIIKGFLNLSLTDTYWLELLQENYSNDAYGRMKANGKK